MSLLGSDVYIYHTWYIYDIYHIDHIYIYIYIYIIHELGPSIFKEWNIFRFSEYILFALDEGFYLPLNSW